jgi:hypothetical protein
MSQTALNLISISVFAMTVSTLLGPMFNLSPVIPAVATFSLLGFFTIDSVSLRGTGATLLVDTFAGFSAEHRSRVVRHEAGHFLVAHLLGIPITGYALNAWESLQQGHPARGGVRFADSEVLSELEGGTLSAQLFDRYCTVWMAGIAAETLVYDTARGGAEDRTKLRAILAQNRRSATDAQLKERWATLQAKTLIESHLDAYEALVTAMEKRTPVAECYHILGEFIAEQ